ncbi:hypothetical protein BDW02DRAFT_289030 [Decorospora gaudefroyi]|uniref:alpha-galactosidase n=1 Tax=Decorospora gaudefroyi TaxID=184978 RepID=A0A6A5KIY9_9PLEO|nr:hypothetical protein BDW02DRAFT_289030 [Decorospora gaudefroyi]
MLSWILWIGFVAISCLAQNATFTRGQKFQIILLGVPDMPKMPLPPTDAPVWDIDLFDNSATTVATLKAPGKIVICYFSAGTAEDWREDYKDFAAADLGKVLPEWPNERWVRITSQAVRNIMAKRIKMAADKGCDALDPDNTDGYQNNNGLNLKPTDSIAYMRFLQTEASKHSMKIGLKNSLDILPDVTPIIDFAVNEQCAQLGECQTYDNFIALNKPVFHIEYPKPLDAQAAKGLSCTAPGVTGLSTILKSLHLDGITYYCDGSFVDTPTVNGTVPGRPSAPPKPSNPPGTTVRPTSTKMTSTRTSTTTRKPTSTPGGGCTSKHWDQCGGRDWKGCTVCQVRFFRILLVGWFDSAPH